ncbi:hypothetical protein [Methanobacterium ferruginis]|uniref:hypothetical protein n=1 Tax=Methanobacterium ferruginis TaxID=710191 RepID=UPI0025726FEE|nr:hypothetical protein [Methanobacterium ferruginis]BDZ68949.1 hypothetical protein GCM10025860_23970 [Methanobacterium ferruginis]
MSTLITNIQDSLLTDVLSQTDISEVIFIYEGSNLEEPVHEHQDTSLFSNLNLPTDVLIEKQGVSLNDTESASHELYDLVSDIFKKSSDVYFALEGNLLGWQILKAAKTFNIKKVYVLQAGKLKEFEVCFIEGC